MSSVRFWLICFALFGITQLVHCATLRCYWTSNCSLDTYKAVSLDDMESLLDYEGYNSSRPNFFWISGFEATANGSSSTQVMSAACSQRQVYNLFLLNWEKEASNILNISTLLDLSFLPVSYAASAIPKTHEVATNFGKGLVRMSKLGFSLNDTHILGHSLGAHLAGQAGRTVTNETNGTQIGWIMGIDPAGPLFGDSISLKASDAKAVHCMHTDPGRYGANSTRCHIDTFVNFETFTLSSITQRVQPGCSAGLFALFSQSSCSHSRAWGLFADAMNSTSVLTASKASDVWEWSRGQGNCSDTVPIALEWDTTKSGLYFMKTNSSSPYGVGDTGACPSS